MKLKNIFKKETKGKSTSKVQSLDKKELEKVIGGTETDPTRPMIGGVLSGSSKQTQGATFGE